MDNIENEPIEQPVVDAPAEGISAPGDESEVPAALKSVDPEKLKALKEKIAKFAQAKGRTMSGSEAVVDAPGGVTTLPEGMQVLTGKDIDWSEYKLDYNIAHLYRRAEFRNTAQGQKWVVMLDEFYSTEKALTMHGKEVKASGPAGQDGEMEALNLGEYITQQVNSAEGWQIAGLMPGSTSRAGVLFQRKSPIVLPDPEPIKRATEVEAPKEEELVRTEDAALDWVKEMGVEAPAPSSVEVEPLTEDAPVEDTVSEGPNYSLVPVARANVDPSRLDENGNIIGQPTKLTTRALELNPGSAPELLGQPLPPVPSPVDALTRPGKLIAGAASAAEALDALIERDAEGNEIK